MPGVRHGRLLALALALTGAVLAGCSGGEAPRGTVNVPMYDNFFAREVTRVPAGSTVRFPNEGRAPHNAVAVDGTWRTPERIGADEAATVVLDQPGVYRFYCTFHATEDGRQGMAATMVVGDVTFYPGQEDGGPAVAPVKRASGVTRRVPEDHDTIQAAVDAAKPGDLVLVGPGTYREEVKVAVPSLVIRGRDRDEVVVDGEFQRPNGIAVTADGVAVENLTVRNALINGLFWTGVRGYRASYVTAYNNKDYGIYAFDSVDGLFEHSYASGSPDSGFYIGQCHPCDAVIDGVLAENNGLGYSGTNAGGNLQIVRSTWRRNWAGIVPNTLDSELLPPFRQVDIVGNLVEANHNRGAPGVPLEWGPFGNGIVLGGGNDSRVERNRVATTSTTASWSPPPLTSTSGPRRATGWWATWSRGRAGPTWPWPPRPATATASRATRPGPRSRWGCRPSSGARGYGCRCAWTCPPPWPASARSPRPTPAPTR